MGATNILQKKVIIAIDAMLFCFDFYIKLDILTVGKELYDA